MLKVLTVDQAVLEINRRFEGMGYRKVNKAKNGTRYYSKANGTTYFKIRLSDHMDAGRNDDVVADIVLNSDTIMSDIEYRVKNAHTQFETALRNQDRRKTH